MEMSDELYNKIVDLCDEGNELIEEDEYQQAIDKLKQGLALIPEPIYEWEASTWIYAALGDACYFDEQYENGANYLSEALKCPDGIVNPFILLRLGQCYFELGRMDLATDYLLRAYMLEGDEIFEDEPEKYYDVIENLV